MKIDPFYLKMAGGFGALAAGSAAVAGGIGAKTSGPDDGGRGTGLMLAGVGGATAVGGGVLMKASVKAMGSGGSGMEKVVTALVMGVPALIGSAGVMFGGGLAAVGGGMYGGLKGVNMLKGEH